MSMYQPLPNDCSTDSFAASMNECHSSSAASASSLPHVASGAVRFASSLRRARCAMTTCGYWPKRAKYLDCIARTRSMVLRSAVVVADPPQRAAVRSGIDAGRSAPPCDAVKMTGAFPAMYSMNPFAPKYDWPGTYVTRACVAPAGRMAIGPTREQAATKARAARYLRKPVCGLNMIGIKHACHPERSEGPRPIAEVPRGACPQESSTTRSL